jgi:Ca2+-binding RTX toxin-like protein
MSTVTNNSLSDVELFKSFLKTIKTREGDLPLSGLSKKMDFLQKLSNELTSKIGIPNITIRRQTFSQYDLIGKYDSYAGNVATFNTTRLEQGTLDEFHKVTLTLYHEIRHAEQVFRGLQYWHQVLGYTAPVLYAPEKPGQEQQQLGKNIDNASRTTLIPLSRKSHGKRMLDLYYLAQEPKNTKYVKESIERDSFVFNREGYKLISNKSPESWYRSAFENVEYDVVRRADGSLVSKKFIDYVDPTTGSASGSYAQWINLSTAKPFSISSLNQRIGNSFNDTIDLSTVAGPINGSSNDLVEGRAGNDFIDGGQGDDFLHGDEGADTLKGSGGNDSLDGGQGNDLLQGDVGDDTLDGGIGNDIMNGGNGDDAYYVDSSGDTIQGESGTNGNDSVYSIVSINLPNFVEDLYLIGEGSITGAGNALNNRIIGNNKNNILNGLSGNDALYGLAGNDTLKGGDGNDYLDGDDEPYIVDVDSETVVPLTDGSDRMEGGNGNDAYVVNSIGDTVIENVAEGTSDIVISSVSYNLGVHLEDLQLTGSGNLTGAGNTLNNIITGNDQVNILNGLGGNDILSGKGGNDRLVGDIGDDILNGGAGSDTLTGGSGFDRFALGTPSEVFSSLISGIDTFVDFQPGVDKIQLQRSSFANLTTIAGSALKSSEFALAASDASAATSLGLIVYSQSSGRLFYNSNGAAIGYGTGGEMAILSNKPILAASNIVVV